MLNVVSRLKATYPGLVFTAGSEFFWSPESHEIFYKESARGKTAIWSLLHETGHALLGHAGWKADYQLIKLEMSAWQKAKELATEFGTEIDDDHIEDCLDTYRDWLHRRSLCPTCNNKSLQQDDYEHYHCFNCHTTWKVSPNRFARTYRRSKDVAQPAIFI